MKLLCWFIGAALGFGLVACAKKVEEKNPNDPSQLNRCVSFTVTQIHDCVPWRYTKLCHVVLADGTYLSIPNPKLGVIQTLCVEP